jgi:hypothetical protein
VSDEDCPLQQWYMCLPTSLPASFPPLSDCLLADLRSDLHAFGGYIVIAAPLGAICHTDLVASGCVHGCLDVMWMCLLDGHLTRQTACSVQCLCCPQLARGST